MRRPADWPLRAKLLAVLALPVVAALALAAARIVDGAHQTSDDRRAVEAIRFDRTSSKLTSAVQDERVAMATWLAAESGDHERLDPAIGATDRAWRAVERSVHGGAQSAVRAAERRIGARMHALGKLRQLARAREVTPKSANAAYSAVVQTLLEPTGDSGSGPLRERQNALQALATAKEDAALQNLYLELGAVRGKFASTELHQLDQAGAELVASIKRFDALAPADDQRSYSSLVSGTEVNNQFQLKQLAAQRATSGTGLGLNPDEVRNNAKSINDRFRTVLARTYDNVADYARNQLADARTSLIVTSAVLVIGLAVTLALMFVIGRAMLRRLRTLRDTALQVANAQLPAALQRILSAPDPRAAAQQAIEPVGVHTTEEIGQVARAFDEVHGQAVRQATDQALLRENLNRILVNLARRSQGLVQRQLGVLDRLEEREQDPDRLTDLFELDHLATRLRRNGESLLVLSGSGPANQVVRPTSAADIVGAAVSETEEYRRIEVGNVPEVSVRGQAVHDLVHLLAELLDNATYFAEQSTAVHVRAALSRESALAVQITDSGVGMTEQQLESANRQLAEPPDLDVSVTRRMGLYVVARLGKKHGIEVRLHENDDTDGGTVARVVVPAQLLTDRARASSGLPPQVSVRELARQAHGVPGPAEPAGTGSMRGHSTGDVGAPPVSASAPGAHDGDGVVPAPRTQDDPMASDMAPDTPSSKQRRHDELVRRGAPIYREMLSAWLDEPAEQDGSPLPDARQGAEDPGWQAVAGIDEPGLGASGTGGLPRRVPNAQLVPGSLQGAPDSAGFGERSAAAARERMARFQRGFLAGRAAIEADEPETFEQTDSFWLADKERM